MFKQGIFNFSYMKVIKYTCMNVKEETNNSLNEVYLGTDSESDKPFPEKDEPWTGCFDRFDCSDILSGVTFNIYIVICMYRRL